MRRLLLMRHAKSSWRDAGLDDHERPLNGRGKRAAPQMGQLLDHEDLVPELVLSSTAVRAVQTTKEVMKACEYDGPVEVTRRLYLAEPSAYYDVLAEVEPGTERVLVVGHNPGISDLVAELTGEALDMPTAALADLEVDVEEICHVDRSTSGRLVGFHRAPKDEKKKKKKK